MTCNFCSCFVDFRCLDLTNKICHVFLMGFVPGVFVNVGLFLALLYSLDSGWDIAINSIYPLYLYSFMAGLCLLGQAVNNSVGNLTFLAL